MKPKDFAILPELSNEIELYTQGAAGIIRGDFKFSIETLKEFFKIGEFSEAFAYEITGQTGTAITISNAEIANQNDYLDVHMDMLICEVKRGSTLLRYNRTSPNQVEYYAVQSGVDVIIHLGRAALASDVFRILIKKTT